MLNTAQSVWRLSPTIVLAGLLSSMPGSISDANAGDPHPATAFADMSEEQAAAKRYVARVTSLLATRIVPGLRRGILRVAASRPSALTVEVIDDPSPYRVGVKLDAAGSLTVRLSLGYLTMHDAALDAVALSAVMRGPRDLCGYLLYQLQVARENYRRRAQREAPRHAMTFAEFAGLDPMMAQAIYAQDNWRASRERVEVESLGWAIAYLLVRADAKLGRTPQSPITQDGAAATRLAAASGWFPVPPFATALHLAEITQAPTDAWDERALLCRAIRLTDSGVASLRADATWAQRLEQDAVLKSRVADIRSQIATMRHDRGCVPAEVTT